MATLATAALIAAAAAPPSLAASPSCKSLSASKIPVAALKASYRKLTGLPANRPLNGSQPQRFGVCAGTHYAFELFTVRSIKGLSYRQQVAQQDHSAVWRQKRNGGWIDEGLDDPCKLAPPALINLWKIGDDCKT
ncbi:MAG TPA: hypothetical protein VGG41_07285 [Solirubrobacteraceae bacterium]